MTGQPCPKPTDTHVRVGISNGVTIWLTMDAYDLMNDNSHVVIWMASGEVHVLPIDEVQSVDPHNFYFWTTKCKFEKYGRPDEWTSSSMVSDVPSINAFNEFYGIEEKSEENGHVPYDPRLGF